MTVSTRAAKKVTAWRFANAAVVAAFLSALGAAQGMGDMPMPENCDKYLQQCSLKIWPRDSFAHAGDTHSVTFSNGKTLTCTSRGHDKPRDCKITLSPADQAQAEAVRQRCDDLNSSLSDLMQEQGAIKSSAGQQRAFFAQAMKMTPEMLDGTIQRMQFAMHAPQGDRYPATPLPPEMIEQREKMQKKELDFLMQLRANQALGPEVSESPEKMQAKADRIVKDQATWANDQLRAYKKNIKEVRDQIAKLKCDSESSANR